MSGCFTEIVEKELPGTDVIAAGVPGYGTAQELLFYERELARFEPNLVLQAFGINNLNDSLLGHNAAVASNQYRDRGEAP